MEPTNAEIMAKLDRIEDLLLTGQVVSDAAVKISMIKANCIAKGIDMTEMLNRQAGVKTRGKWAKKQRGAAK